MHVFWYKVDQSGGMWKASVWGYQSNRGYFISYKTEAEVLLTISNSMHGGDILLTLNEQDILIVYYYVLLLWLLLYRG